MKLRCQICGDYIRCEKHGEPLDFSFITWLRVKLHLIDLRRVVCLTCLKIRKKTFELMLADLKKTQTHIEKLRFDEPIPMKEPDYYLKKAIEEEKRR